MSAIETLGTAGRCVGVNCSYQMCRVPEAKLGPILGNPMETAIPAQGQHTQ